MKANQKFMEADDAVSPVIGVILMVAITVVLAAVVFVLVSDLGGGSGSTQPAMSWSVSQAAGTATITAADPGADWSEFEIRFSEAGAVGINCDVDDNACDTATNRANVAGTSAYAPLPAGSIGGGDVLYFCVDGSAGPLTATLRHIDSNSVAREFSFNNAPQCTASS